MLKGHMFWSLVLAAVVTTAVTITAAPAVQAAGDEYDAMRARWEAALDGGPDLNLADPAIRARVDSLSADAESLLSTMDKTPTSYIWSDLSNPSGSGRTAHNTYVRLRTMALAWSTEGTTVYQDPTVAANIVTALDWVNANWYNDTTVEEGGWWEWELGIPLKLGDIMVLMYPQLTATQIGNYVAAIYHFAGSQTADPGWIPTNGNGSDLLMHQLLCAMVTKNSTKLDQVVSKFSHLLGSVTSGNGFYADNSYLDHATVAYTLSYGRVLFTDMANILYILHGSAWQVDDPDLARFYDRIYNAYQPLIYRGAAMDLVRGRAMSREGESDHQIGQDIIAGVARVGLVAPAPHAGNFAAMVKYWVGADTYLDFFSSRVDLGSLVTVRAILDDGSVGAWGEPVGHYAFNSMDRTLHRRPGFALAISKSSKRVRNYELMNNENKKGWYQGDGATYLYNGDLSQFSDDFWPTVNSQRLPGTTLEVRTRSSTPDQYGDGEGQPSNSWSGGTALGEYGVSGMQLIPLPGTNPGSLNALKSWFMFDNEVVALGSGIKTTTPRGYRVETVIENRKLTAAGDNAFSVNGVAKPTTPGWGEDMTGVRWAHLQGNVSGADIGYYFPGGASVQGVRQTRSGRWADINGNGSTTTRTRHYLTLTAQHGVDPTNGSYSYALLPNMDSAQTSAYADSPDIEIVENSIYVHAVREKTQRMTGYNFWTDSVRSSGDVTSNKRASIMTREVLGDAFEIAVSDPTQENTGTITVEIDRQGTGVISSDPQVTVVQTAPTIILNVNVNGARGKAFKAAFDLAPPIANGSAGATTIFSDNFDNQAVGSAPAGWTLSVPTGTTVAIDGTPSVTDKSVKMTDGTSSNRARAKRTFAATTGTVVAEWRFMEPGAATNYPYFYVTGGGVGAVSMNSGRGYLNYVSATGVTHPVVALQPNTWYSVKVVLDVASKRYDIYVDGQLCEVRASFVNPSTSIDGIEIITGYAAAPHTLYFDDVRLARE